MCETTVHGPKMTREQMIRLIRSAVLRADALLFDPTNTVVRWFQSEDGCGWVCVVDWTRSLRSEHQYGFVGRCDAQVTMFLRKQDASLASFALTMLECELYQDGMSEEQFKKVEKTWFAWSSGAMFDYTTSVRDGDDVVWVNVECRIEE